MREHMIVGLQSLANLFLSQAAVPLTQRLQPRADNVRGGLIFHETMGGFSL